MQVIAEDELVANELRVKVHDTEASDTADNSLATIQIVDIVREALRYQDWFWVTQSQRVVLGDFILVNTGVRIVRVQYQDSLTVGRQAPLPVKGFDLFVFLFGFWHE